LIGHKNYLTLKDAKNTDDKSCDRKYQSDTLRIQIRSVAKLDGYCDETAHNPDCDDRNQFGIRKPVVMCCEDMSVISMAVLKLNRERNIRHQAENVNTIGDEK